MALHLLKVLDGSEEVKKARTACVKALTQSVSDPCMADKPSQRHVAELLRDVELLHGDQVTRANVDRFLGLSAVLMMSGLTATKLCKWAAVDDISIDALFSMHNLHTDLVYFHLSAVKMHHALSLSPQPYVRLGDTEVTALLEGLALEDANVVRLAAPKLVIGSWNMCASDKLHDPDAPSFLRTKLENLAKVAKREGMSLIALQECPSDSTCITNSLLSLQGTEDAGTSTAFFSSWDYVQAGSSGEQVGFMYDRSLLEIVTPPVVFPKLSHTARDTSCGGAAPVTSISHGFKSPPVLAIFEAAKLNVWGANNAAQQLGLIVVCNVHRKSPSIGTVADPSQADIRLLASGPVQGWISKHISDAKAAQLGGSSCNHCVLIVGDINQAGNYYHAAAPPHLDWTHPGLAWEGLDSCGYKRLLLASITTHLGHPVAETSCAFDTAFVLFSDNLIVRACRARAYVCDFATKEVADFVALCNLRESFATPDPGNSEAWDAIVHIDMGVMIDSLRRKLSAIWGNHKPMAIHI